MREATATGMEVYPTNRILAAIALSGVLLFGSACSSPDGLSDTEKGAATGAVVGGVIGNQSDETAEGAALGAAAGAALGAVTGDDDED